MIHDVFVAGLGVLGGAVARAAARAGLRVAGCDARRPPHDRGSSHGESRILRAAYFEGAHYARLARRALALWRALEAESGRALFRATGGLHVGPADGALLRAALESARSCGIPHQRLDAAELMRRYPALQVGEEHAAVFEPDAGILDPERCVAAQIDSARAAGAELRLGEELLGWRRAGAVLRIETAGGEFAARALVLALGAWLPERRPELPLQVTRQAVFWFDPLEPGLHAPDRLPHYLIEFAPGRVFYGFPDLGRGLKCAVHREGELTMPDSVDRGARPVDLVAVRELVARFLPRAAGRLRDSAVCLYTNAPDGHFLVDRDPRDPGVWLLCACSGHGFKFAPALAELLLEALAGRAAPALAPFALDRFPAAGRQRGRS